MKLKNILGLVLFVGIIFAWGCNKNDDFITKNSAKLEFSLDTLRFDTVFTQLGSATRSLKIYNRHDQPILISKIMIAQNESSRFRINVDGLPGNTATDVEIPPNDSIYIFGEVTVNPDDPLSVSPFIIEDELLFETNGNMQSVLLEAWGQNANYFPSRFYKDSIVVLSCSGGTLVWDDPKPYVIYGIVIVDDCILNIIAGREIYVHGGITQGFNEEGDFFSYNSGGLVIGSNGKIIIEGTVEEPVIVQGDRLEEDFEDVVGQWNGLYITPGSSGNIIENAVIKNSRFSIAVDSGAELSMKNTAIFNTASTGLVGSHATITAENCLFYNTGQNCVSLGYGGNYDFTYCTLASYGVQSAALNLGNVLCLDQFCSEARLAPLQANFRNSIIFGSSSDEITLFEAEEAPFDYNFENCIVRVKDLIEEDDTPDFFDNCNPCINAVFSDTLFVNTDEDDYHLDTLSIAEEAAIPILNISIDLEGKMRDSNTPDIGCYEYFPN